MVAHSGGKDCSVAGGRRGFWRQAGEEGDVVLLVVARAQRTEKTWKRRRGRRRVENKKIIINYNLNC